MIVLRKSMLVDIRKVRTFETDLSCRMVTASRAVDGLVGEGGGWDLLSGGQGGVQGAGHQHSGGGWEQQALLHRCLGEEQYLLDWMRELVVDPQPLPLGSQDLREEHVEVVEIETGDTEEHGNLIRGSFPEGILSADSLSTDLIPTAFTDPAPL